MTGFAHTQGWMWASLNTGCGGAKKGRPCKEATVLVGMGGTVCPKKRGFNLESEFKSNCEFVAIA